MKIDNKLNLELKKITISAGKEILKIYRKPFKKKYKSDKSPITAADIAANNIICQGLENLTPCIPIISEENDIRPRNLDLFWLVDPLDGTKEFIKKNGEFTVNIALIENNKPILGVIFAPAKSKLYFAQKKNGSFKINTKVELNTLNIAKKIFVSKKSNVIKVIGSRSHSNIAFTNWVNEKFPNAKIIQAGSSLKFCLIAEGDADIYPRFGPTSEWDIAAGHIILNEAGGKISTFKNCEINYNTKEDILNPEFYAIGSVKL